MRILLAFVGAVVSASLGIAASGKLQGAIRHDSQMMSASPILALVFGVPFVAAAALVAVPVYVLARRARRLSPQLATVAGVVIGAVAAALAQMPILPWWSGGFVGALAGWTWWTIAGFQSSSRMDGHGHQ